MNDVRAQFIFVEEEARVVYCDILTLRGNETIKTVFASLSIAQLQFGFISLKIWNNVYSVWTDWFLI